MKIKLDKPGILKECINTLDQSLKIYKTNEPINRKENKIEQADLEARYIKSIELGIKILKNYK